MSDRRNNLRDGDRPTVTGDVSPSSADAPRPTADRDQPTADGDRRTENLDRRADGRGRRSAIHDRAADNDRPAPHDQSADEDRSADQYRSADQDRSAAHGGIGAEEISQAADALFFAMRRARTASAEQHGGLSLPQVALLEPLATEPDLPVGRLASGADVSVPTATRMLQQLESKGVVVRRRSPEDERRVLVSLTDDGAERLAALRSRLRERQARAYEAFTPAERALLVTLLHRLTDLVADPGTS
ncbi:MULTISPECIES: MarR family winged helix-turn-helix transcriptional regulator [unclassified Streptomyces]|uniref:MarR family winged helix-turn-helix transcriptional regulator n=1 Tax=unclassified Streptomyces TaxID=2593676 RepID=UPI000DC251EF|nr:MarR family transcriptional regulator [Streptomyces sp. PsTaAH-130]RAJ65905.1 DNA-binding MarR family transcriptional regulator [Streptomyces sp. PsTaAH-130]